MKIERERYDELLSSEITLAQVMRAHNEMSDFSFSEFCDFLFGESEAKKRQAEAVKRLTAGTEGAHAE